MNKLVIQIYLEGIKGVPEEIATKVRDAMIQIRQARSIWSLIEGILALITGWWDPIITIPERGIQRLIERELSKEQLGTRVVLQRDAVFAGMTVLRKLTAQVSGTDEVSIGEAIVTGIARASYSIYKSVVFWRDILSEDDWVKVVLDSWRGKVRLALNIGKFVLGLTLVVKVAFLVCALATLLNWRKIPTLPQKGRRE